MSGWNIDLNSSKDAKKIEDIFEQRIVELMKAASIEFWRQVVISTPVDTGFARFGWFITVKTPSKYLPPEGQESYPMPNLADHSEIRPFTVNDTLFITNNVPYIDRLNNGYSRQAPANFVEMAAARVQKAVSKKAAQIK
jgi:hypothetical protein